MCIRVPRVFCFGCPLCVRSVPCSVPFCFWGEGADGAWQERKAKSGIDFADLDTGLVLPEGGGGGRLKG